MLIFRYALISLALILVVVPLSLAQELPVIKIQDSYYVALNRPSSTYSFEDVNSRMPGIAILTDGGFRTVGSIIAQEGYFTVLDGNIVRIDIVGKITEVPLGLGNYFVETESAADSEIPLLYNYGKINLKTAATINGILVYPSESDKEIKLDLYTKTIANKLTGKWLPINEKFFVQNALFDGMPVFLVDMHAGLLKPTESKPKFKDKKLAEEYIRTIDAEIRNPSNALIDRNSLAIALTSQAMTLYTPIDGYHNDAGFRQAMVQHIPKELFFYLIAGTNANIGTEKIYLHSSLETVNIQWEAYPSTFALLIKEYTTKAGDPLKDALKYRDLMLFRNFLQTIAITGRANSLLEITDSATRQTYLEIYFDYLQGGHTYSPELIAPDVNSDYAGYLVFKDALASDKLKQDAKTVMLNKLKGKPLSKKIQYLIISHSEQFTEAELKQFDSSYQDKEFPNFSPIVRKLYKDSIIKLDKMLTCTETECTMKGAAYFGSLGDSNEQGHYENFVNKLVSDLNMKKELLTDDFGTPRTETWTGKKFSYYLLSKEEKLTVDGVEKDYTLELYIYPRPSLSTDPLVNIIITRGHLDACRSIINQLESQTNRPIVANFGGCYESGNALEILSEYSAETENLRISATSGTGRGDINNLLNVGLLKSIELGLTNEEEQENFIKNYVETAICGKCDERAISNLDSYTIKLYEDWQYYKLYSYFKATNLHDLDLKQSDKAEFSSVWWQHVLNVVWTTQGVR